MALTSPTLLCGVFGFVSGTLSGFLGIGGGAILAPLLVLVLGFEQHRAQGISLAALVPPVGLPAVLAYRRSGVVVDTRLVLLLLAGFVVGVTGGAWLAHRVPASGLRWTFAVFLVVSAWRAFASTASEGDDATAAREASVGVTAPGRRRWGVVIGLAAGSLSGLLGIGGGIVALPLLRRFLRLPRLTAQATTLAMLLPPIGLPAVFVYAREQGGLPWALLVTLAIGFSLGAALGAFLSGRVSSRLASRVYGALLVVLAALTVGGR